MIPHTLHFSKIVRCSEGIILIIQHVKNSPFAQLWSCNIRLLYLALIATTVDTYLQAESVQSFNCLSMLCTVSAIDLVIYVVVTTCTACYTSFAQHICSKGCTSPNDAQRSSVA
jgi:hypothetical protein